MATKPGPPTVTGRARLADVARLAGVSVPTASKILNRVADVSARDTTRQRVFDAASTLGYRPSVLARALAGAPTRALALLVEDITKPMHSRTIRSVYSAGTSLGYTILIVEDSQEGNASLIDLVAAGHVDGILVASARIDRPLPRDLTSHGIPHVFLNREVPSSGRNVTMDLAAASALAVTTLVDLGHRHIGHVAGPDNVETAHTRASAFSAAAAAHGALSAPISHARFNEESGAQAAVHLLGSGDITAIYTSSVSQAVGAMFTLAGHGLRVPDDVSVIAYGEMPLAAFLSPALDTVDMPLAELGRTAVEVLVNQINGDEPADVVIATAPAMVHRASVGPARIR